MKKMFSKQEIRVRSSIFYFSRLSTVNESAFLELIYIGIRTVLLTCLTYDLSLLYKAINGYFTEYYRLGVVEKSDIISDMK